MFIISFLNKFLTVIILSAPLKKCIGIEDIVPQTKCSKPPRYHGTSELMDNRVTCLHGQVSARDPDNLIIKFAIFDLYGFAMHAKKTSCTDITHFLFTIEVNFTLYYVSYLLTIKKITDQ